MVIHIKHLHPLFPYALFQIAIISFLNLSILIIHSSLPLHCSFVQPFVIPSGTSHPVSIPLPLALLPRHTLSPSKLLYITCTLISCQENNNSRCHCPSVCAIHSTLIFVFSIFFTAFTSKPFFQTTNFPLLSSSSHSCNLLLWLSLLPTFLVSSLFYPPPLFWSWFSEYWSTYTSCQLWLSSTSFFPPLPHSPDLLCHC